jgi:two-component system, OmpR family, sensor histidine kinase KdpD
MMDERPSPDKLLQRFYKEESEVRRGKLKIYLGAAPGVGKTYTMLQDALAERALGLDVIIGVVESHGRKELTPFIKEFETLPKQGIQYHGKEISEFDLDGALKRAPAVILMDEMAHSNAPGLRHAKRWMDIKELLDRGIDVYTTLNVQHVESLNYDVSRIVGTIIKETVPDFMLDQADSIELVDLSPDDLIKRLHEGKVYIPEQAALATEHFFQKGNLSALRELALRTTAKRVGDEVMMYRRTHGISRVWPTKEKILVCVGPGQQSVKLIRAARRLAKSLQAEWIVVNIETPSLQVSEERRRQTIENLRLAEKLGADTHVLTGFDIVKEVMSFSREQNVTLIMIWKHIRARWRDYFFRSLSDEMVRASGEIDVYVMTGSVEDHIPKDKSNQTPRTLSFTSYGLSFALVAIATATDFLLFPYFQPSNLIMIYFLGVTFVALMGQRGPSILASILSVLAYDFFFIPPYFSFAVSDVEYFMTLVVMLVITQIISYFVILTRRQVESAKFAERQTSALHTLSRRLASTRGVDKLLNAGVEYIAEIFKCEVMAIIPKDSKLIVRATSQKGGALDEKELSIAQWVCDMGQVAGLGTDTLPFSDALYIPLLTLQSTIGVLRIYPKHKRPFSPEELRLLDICVNQIALAIEVDRLQRIEKT